jgi:peptidoglycan/xylan/chitin deacetylase (PgdA/CDA1 family)
MKKHLRFILKGLIIFIAVFLAVWKISSSKSFQFFGGITHRVDTDERVVALTFDDGPTEKTEEILALLERLEVKGTFFLTGRELERNMEEAKKIVSAGHELGNHTFAHKRMVFRTPSFMRREIDLTDALIREAGYEGEIHFRPPYAKKLFLLPYILKKKNKKTIMWDLEPDSDLSVSAEEIVNDVVENVSKR